MENWMSRISDSKKLILINIPSTHDSACYYMNHLLLPLAKTQYYTIKQQLEIGTRKLDIRIVDIKKNKEIDEDLICCHGICDCYASQEYGDMRKLTLKSILIDIRNFLKQYPSETVLLEIRLGRGKNKDTLQRAYEMFIKYVGDMYINFHHDLCLGESRGKVVNITYLLHEFDRKRLNIINFKSSNICGTGIEEVHKKYKKYSAFKVDGNLKIQEIKDMFQKYNMTLQEAEIEEKKNTKLFPINYSISCTGEKTYCFPNPLDQAKIVHSYIQRDGVFKKGYYYGWIKMDFANYLSNYKLIDTNFINNYY